MCLSVKTWEWVDGSLGAGTKAPRLINNSIPDKLPQSWEDTRNSLIVTMVFRKVV